jgi:hypothetical protein
MSPVIKKISILSSLLLLLLPITGGGEVSISSDASSIAGLTSTAPSSSPLSATRPFNNTSTFGQVPFEPIQQPQQPQRPALQQPQPQVQVPTQDRIQETLKAVLTANASTTKALLLNELEQSIENLTSNQYDVTVDFTESENGEDSYLISIDRITGEDSVVAEDAEEEEEDSNSNGNDSNGDDDGSIDGNSDGNGNDDGEDSVYG